MAKREAGLRPLPGRAQRRERKINPFVPKVEGWVERSRGKFSADVVFAGLRSVGCSGSVRTVRRAVGGSQTALLEWEPPDLSA
jgi:hypothetical protein